MSAQPDEGRLTRRRIHPFSILPEALLYSPTLSDRAKVLWGCLARHADAEDRCFPGYPLLAKHLHCSRASVWRAMAELQAEGWVTITARYRDDGGQASNDYVIYEVPIPAENRTVSATPPSRGRDRGTRVDAIGPFAPARDQEGESLELDPEERDSPVSQKAAKRRSQLPNDFELTEERRAKALARGVPSSRVEHEFEQFGNWHLAHGSLMLDWDAAWRTWAGKFRGVLDMRPDDGLHPSVVAALAQASGSNP